MNIFDHLNDRYIYIQNLYPDHSFFGIFLRGSQNYGLDIYNDNYQSDIDTVVFIIPTLHDLINKTTYNKEIIYLDNSHIELKDIRDLELLIFKANPTYIELINTDYYIINETYQLYYNQIQDKCNEISLVNFDRLLKAILGMMHTYLKKGFNNRIYDVKCLTHIIRFRIMVTYLLQGSSFKEAMTLNKKDRSRLLKIKSHEIIYDYHEAYDIAVNEINSVENMINTYQHTSIFNQQAYDYLYNIIENIIKYDLKQSLLY
ncbi:MAG: hypothetical protein LUH02_07450 [Erysipelotrichaceae bacterium]|nr:hypothetical protein [Erysipelotrichaceae bacterium]